MDKPNQSVLERVYELSQIFFQAELDYRAKYPETETKNWEARKKLQQELLSPFVTKMREAKTELRWILCGWKATPPGTKKKPIASAPTSPSSTSH